MDGGWATAEIPATVVSQATPTDELPGDPPFPYGVVYGYEESDWTEADRASIRQRFIDLSDLGVSTLVQTFSSRLIGTDRTADWTIFLDEAERAGIGVITRLWPLPEWDGHTLDLSLVNAFLAVVGDHPAFRAYIGLHEPLEKYDSDQMRDFYAQFKQANPEIPLAHYMGNMALFESSYRFTNRRFTDGICDICIVWSTPARYLDGVAYLDEEDVATTVRDNRRLIDTRSPESELWYLGQAYALAEHRHALRMPEPDEMETIFQIAYREGVDGFLWYPWFHSVYDQVLGDSESAAQRRAVKTIYENYLQGIPTGMVDPVQSDGR